MESPRRPPRRHDVFLAIAIFFVATSRDHRAVVVVVASSSSSSPSSSHNKPSAISSDTTTTATAVDGIGTSRYSDTTVPSSSSSSSSSSSASSSSLTTHGGSSSSSSSSRSSSSGGVVSFLYELYEHEIYNQRTGSWTSRRFTQSPVAGGGGEGFHLPRSVAMRAPPELRFRRRVEDRHGEPRFARRLRVGVLRRTVRRTR